MPSCTASIAAVAELDADDGIGCIVITGAGDKAFVAGADIKEMADKSYMDMFMADAQSRWERFAATRTPMIAAVNGFALGGGCEIAMMCDIIIASETAKFGQPEIKLGVIPGWGGTQRLTKAVGKAKAMDLILTGRMMDAEEAERCRPRRPHRARRQADGRSDRRPPRPSPPIPSPRP